MMLSIMAGALILGATVNALIKNKNNNGLKEELMGWITAGLLVADIVITLCKKGKGIMLTWITLGLTVADIAVHIYKRINK